MVLCAFTVLLILPAPGSAKMKLKVNCSDNSVTPADMYTLHARFKELVEEQTDEVEIVIYENSSLGGEQEGVQDCRSGSLDFVGAAINNVSPFSKTCGILSLPYIMQSHEDAVRLTTGKIGQYWKDVILKEAGVRLLAFSYSGFRHLSNSKRPIDTIQDIQDLKIRVPKNAQMIESYKSWGISPIPMAWPELFTAMQQKVVDGQDTPYTVMNSCKFYEVQKYITDLHYNYSLQTLIISEKVFRKLSPKLQQIMIKAGMEAQAHNILFQLNASNSSLEALKAKGMKHNKLKDEDKWIKLAKEKVWPQFYKDFGGKDKVDYALKLIGK